MPAHRIHPPPFRRLRAYAFDPSLQTQLETAPINEVVLKVRWERDRQTQQDLLGRGPVGEYLEVVDYDPASGCFYEPVDLNDPYLLAQDGLPPSEGNPQFHQQMVYAIAMTTIQHFEQALGRLALWSPHITRNGRGKAASEYVRRLRIYPHALREANAYYSPEKKALLFGYFPASITDPGGNLPGGLVFTCLSYDIVAHETTHALLDGLHRYFNHPSNPDVLAFHEAFADVVALLQHFTHPEVLRHQIARTRGDLARQNLLGQLAQQFGQAIGARGALRDAIGTTDPETGRWEPRRPDPTELARTLEPHARGAILVAALFDSFLSIYKLRIADLLRIATSGTGILPEGDLHPDLVNRLSEEASKSATHLLRMCIRALDYCPPVDITFGEYLRAMVTADLDLVPDDDLGYRIALVDAFRRYGVYPPEVRSLATDSLQWQPPQVEFPKVGEVLKALRPDWDLSADRQAVFDQVRAHCAAVHKWVASHPIADETASALGLALGRKAPQTIRRVQGRPVFEVHSVRPARRVGPDGDLLIDLVIEITQKRRGYLDPEQQLQADRGKFDGPEDFTFRGGCTLLLDLESGAPRYCIAKNICSETRLQRQRAYYSCPDTQSLRATYFGDFRTQSAREPFAILHRGI